MSEMKIDIHLHTRFSECSSMTVEYLIEQSRRSDVRAVCCTDHHSVMGPRRLLKETGGALVIPALEIETAEGDVLVYSSDMDYLESLLDFEGSVREVRRDETTCVIWAHPCVSQRESLVGDKFPTKAPFPSALHEQIAAVMPHVDGVEIYNGTMLSLAAAGLLKPTYFKNLWYLSRYFETAATGGSDAHEVELWAKVWTTFPDTVNTVADFVAALRERRVRPDYDRAFFPPDLDVNP